MNWKGKMSFLPLKTKRFAREKMKGSDNQSQGVVCPQAQRKYELELENRRTFERNLEEIQRLYDNERQVKNQMGVTNREWTEKISNLERQVNLL